jgi:hypothetical protein
MPAAPRVTEVVAGIERDLAARLGLRRRLLPEDLATFHGTWKGHPVVVDTTAWDGPAIAYGRVVTVRGGDLDIGNLLYVPRPTLDVPVLGIDLVRARPDVAIVVADLSPVDRQPANDGETPSDAPEWARGILSPQALIARSHPDLAAPLLTRIDAFVNRFMSDVESGRPSRDESNARAGQARYLEAHRRDRPMRQMLAGMTSGAWADRFFADVLFPLPEPLALRRQ